MKRVARAGRGFAAARGRALGATRRLAGLGTTRFAVACRAGGLARLVRDTDAVARLTFCRARFTAAALLLFGLEESRFPTLLRRICVPSPPWFAPRGASPTARLRERAVPSTARCVSLSVRCR